MLKVINAQIKDPMLKNQNLKKKIATVVSQKQIENRVIEMTQVSCNCNRCWADKADSNRVLVYIKTLLLFSSW